MFLKVLSSLTVIFFVLTGRPIAVQTLPKNSMIQTSKKLRTETFFHLSRRFQSGAKVWRELQQVPAINRTAAVQQSIKCFKIHSKDLLQNNDFHITSSIFLLSSVLVFYFFLILFFNSIVYRFFIARIFGVLPEYFRDWGGCRRPPGSYAYGYCLTNETISNNDPNNAPISGNNRHYRLPATMKIQVWEVLDYSF